MGGLLVRASYSMVLTIRHVDHSTENNPYIEVSGNLADGTIPSIGPVVTLGTKSNCHYQSLLPVEMFHLEFQQNQHTSNMTVPEGNVKTEVKPCNIKKEVQEKCEGQFNKSNADKPNNNLQNSCEEDRL